MKRFVIAIAAALAVSTASAAAPPSALAGTHWRLVEFQSMDDAQGTTRPKRMVGSSSCSRCSAVEILSSSPRVFGSIANVVDGSRCFTVG